MIICLLFVFAVLFYWTLIIPLLCLVYGCLLFAFRSVFSDYFLSKFEKDIFRYQTKYKTGFWSKGFNNWARNQKGSNLANKSLNKSNVKKIKKKKPPKNFGWGGIESSHYLAEEELTEQQGGMTEADRIARDNYNGLKELDYRLEYNRRKSQLSLIVTQINMRKRRKEAQKLLESAAFGMLKKMGNSPQGSFSSYNRIPHEKQSTTSNFGRVKMPNLHNKEMELRFDSQCLETEERALNDPELGDPECMFQTFNQKSKTLQNGRATFPMTESLQHKSNLEGGSRLAQSTHRLSDLKHELELKQSELAYQKSKVEFQKIKNRESLSHLPHLQSETQVELDNNPETPKNKEKFENTTLDEPHITQTNAKTVSNSQSLHHTQQNSPQAKEQSSTQPKLESKFSQYANQSHQTRNNVEEVDTNTPKADSQFIKGATNNQIITKPEIALQKSPPSIHKGTSPRESSQKSPTNYDFPPKSPKNNNTQIIKIKTQKTGTFFVSPSNDFYQKNSQEPSHQYNQNDPKYNIYSSSESSIRKEAQNQGQQKRTDLLKDSPQIAILSPTMGPGKVHSDETEKGLNSMKVETVKSSPADEQQGSRMDNHLKIKDEKNGGAFDRSENISVSSSVERNIHIGQLEQRNMSPIGSKLPVYEGYQKVERENKNEGSKFREFIDGYEGKKKGNKEKSKVAEKETRRLNSQSVSKSTKSIRAQTGGRSSNEKNKDNLEKVGNSQDGKGEYQDEHYPSHSDIQEEIGIHNHQLVGSNQKTKVKHKDNGQVRDRKISDVFTFNPQPKVINVKKVPRMNPPKEKIEHPVEIKGKKLLPRQALGERGFSRKDKSKNHTLKSSNPYLGLRKHLEKTLSSHLDESVTDNELNPTRMNN